jgi:hypothetical protein
MSNYVDSAQSADIKRLQRAAREMEEHPKGCDKHTSANAAYQVAFNSLYHQGMTSPEILRLVNVNSNDYTNGGKSQ